MVLLLILIKIFIFNFIVKNYNLYMDHSKQVEYVLVKFDDVAKTAKLSLRAEEILKVLNEKEQKDPL